MPSTAFDEEIIAAVQTWLETAVIGLNLCPFAKGVHVKNQIRYAVSTATGSDALLAELQEELHRLQTSDPAWIDTCLLIVTGMLDDFLDYNDFLAEADALIDASGLRGDIQIASFHPDYQFAGTQPDAIENYTNRSPYPILHLLRESSIDRAVEAYSEPESIFEKNIDTLRRLGHTGWRRLNLPVRRH